VGQPYKKKTSGNTGSGRQHNARNIVGGKNDHRKKAGVQGRRGKKKKASCVTKKKKAEDLQVTNGQAVCELERKGVTLGKIANHTTQG